MARPATGQVVQRDGKRGRTYGIRFRAYGQRHYVTTKATTRAEAEVELANVLADVRRGIWRPLAPTTALEPPRAEATFHEFASEWLQERRPELRPRSIEALEWALSGHLLVFFKDHPLSAISVAEVLRYRAVKVRERESGLVDRPLSNASINRTIAVLAQVLDAAVDREWLATNPARGKRRRLKTEKPRRTWLELDELRAILDSAGEHRALLATMALAGLRVGELVQLRWRDVDLASGRLRVADSKTAAGRRVVDLSPDLLSELKAHRASTSCDGSLDLVFPTKRGTMRDRHNVRSRVLAKAIARANKSRSEIGLAAIQAGVTNHTLRRTFASLLYEAGASPAFVMAQMGHESSALALEVYARMMQRQRDTGARMDALVRGVEWARTGTNELDAAADASVGETAVDAASAVLQELR